MNCIQYYGEKRCENRVIIISGRLRINFMLGMAQSYLIDCLIAGHSDPYVRVIAYCSCSRGSSKNLQTSQHTNDGSPEWNQQFDFGVDHWTRITIKVYDEYGTYDRLLSSVITCHLSLHTPHTNVRKSCDTC